MDTMDKPADLMDLLAKYELDHLYPMLRRRKVARLDLLEHLTESELADLGFDMPEKANLRKLISNEKIKSSLAKFTSSRLVKPAANRKKQTASVSFGVQRLNFAKKYVQVKGDKSKLKTLTINLSMTTKEVIEICSSAMKTKFSPEDQLGLPRTAMLFPLDATMEQVLAQTDRPYRLHVFMKQRSNDWASTSSASVQESWSLPTRSDPPPTTSFSAATCPTPASPTPASPAPVSPTPVSPTPASPTQTSPTPTSPTPASPIPTSPTPASPTPASPTPTSPASLPPSPTTLQPATTSPHRPPPAKRTRHQAGKYLKMLSRPNTEAAGAIRAALQSLLRSEITIRQKIDIRDLSEVLQWKAAISHIIQKNASLAECLCSTDVVALHHDLDWSNAYRLKQLQMKVKGCCILIPQRCELKKLECVVPGMAVLSFVAQREQQSLMVYRVSGDNACDSEWECLENGKKSTCTRDEMEYHLKYHSLMVIVEKYSQPEQSSTAIADEPQRVIDLNKFGEMVSIIKSMERTCEDVKWDDIIGLDAERRLLKNVFIEPMSNTDIFQGPYGKLTTSVLLHGPPGTGKTFLVKGLANYCKATLYIIKPSDILRKYVGESERIIECLFAMARARKPAIIFIDECDSLFADRTQEGGSETMVSLKNQLLVEMDGFEEHPVPIIGATNRVDEIDAAFLRRLGRKIEIKLPNMSDRQKILNSLVHLYAHHPNQQVVVDFSGIDVSDLVTLTEGMSPADIVQLFKSAALEAAVSRNGNIIKYSMEMFQL